MRLLFVWTPCCLKYSSLTSWSPAMSVPATLFLCPAQPHNTDRGNYMEATTGQGGGAALPWIDFTNISFVWISHTSTGCSIINVCMCGLISQDWNHSVRLLMCFFSLAMGYFHNWFSKIPTGFILFSQLGGTLMLRFWKNLKYIENEGLDKCQYCFKDILATNAWICIKFETSAHKASWGWSCAKL